MKKIFNYKIEDKFSALKNNVLEFISFHPNLFCILTLSLLCLVFLFLGLGMYPLIDVDETRYAIIARDMIRLNNFNDLILNGVPFLEKPPLYFWLVAASVKLFNTFSPFVVRFPIALCSTLLIFATYFFGKKTVSIKFGFISATILLTSVFFLIFSHVAILDMLLTVFIALALYCGVITQFCDEKMKKYFWWLAYTCMATGFMAKGILAFAIPVTILFVFGLLTKTLKDMFKPLYFVPGLILFVIATAPWHILMYKQYGIDFINQYFIAHHFARFVNSATIGRERPLLYFVPIFLVGFLPWTFMFLAFIFDGIKKCIKRYKETEGKVLAKVSSIFVAHNNEQKILLFSALSFIIIFLVFSISSTKLPTYILPVFPFAALLMGYFWKESDDKGLHEKSMYAMTLLLVSIFVFAATALTIGALYLPVLSNELNVSTNLQSLVLCGLYLISILLLLRLNTKRALSIFFGYIVVMFFVIVFAVTNLFNIMYKTGENELVEYSQLSEIQNAKLVTFDFAVKPSVLINQKNRVVFITDEKFDDLDRILKCKYNKKHNIYVIVKNKNIKTKDGYEKKLEKRLNLLKRGEKYSLYIREKQSK